MSYAAERWARAQKTGKATDKQILIEIARCADKDSDQCTLTVPYLREVTELKEETITKSTNRLQSNGFLIKTYVATPTGRATRYWLCRNKEGGV